MIFKNRKEASQRLIFKLQEYKNHSQAVVIALPRGGIIPAYEIAKELKLPLDIIITQKIGAPDFPEFAIGAICEDGNSFFNENTISNYDISKDYINNEIKIKKKEAKRRASIYRKNFSPLSLQNKIVLLIDDGIATGATILAAIKSIKSKKPKKIIIVAAVIAPDSLKKIEKEVDQVIYLDAPQDFAAVGQFYENFEQISDDTVINLLEKAHE